MCSRGPGRGEPWTGARAGGKRGGAVLRLLCAPAPRHAANPLAKQAASGPCQLHLIAYSMYICGIVRNREMGSCRSNLSTR